MGRPQRVQSPGSLYHVMSRGNAKQDIFLDDCDRLDFIEKLVEVIGEYTWACYAYCLMDTHYHLLIETPQANLSDGMHELNSYYCKRFNWKHGKVGHVLQERFNSPLIEREEHLREVIRYTALNPVRGGLVIQPEQWIWSSYRAIAGFAFAPGFLDVSYTLGLFSDYIEMARQEYIRFVADGLLSDQEGRIMLQELFQGATDKQERNSAMRIAHYKHGYTSREIAAYLRLNRSTVNRAMRN